MIAQRDKEAVSLLYDRYAPALFSFSVRILSDRLDAEDVLQEVFVQVFRDARRYQPERASVRSWLFTIARSRALDRLRSRRSLDRLSRPPLDGEAEAATAASQESLLLKRHVERQLEKLSDREREVLRLAYYDGCTQEEIAARLGEPLGTVKSRTRSGLGRLRMLLGGARD